MTKSTIKQTEAKYKANIAKSDARKQEVTNFQFSIGKTLNALQTDAQNWETNEFRTSNEILYALLGRCMELATETAEKKTRVSALNKLLESKNINFKGSPSIIVKIVRAVFGVSLKRSSVYSRVLTIAKAAKIKPADLSSWLFEQGGIEEVRSSNSKKSVSRTQLREIGQASLNKVSSKAFVKKTAITPNEAGFVVMYGYVDNKGVTQIMSYSKNDNLIKSYVEKIGRSKLNESKDANSSITTDDLISTIVKQNTSKVKAA